MANPHLNNKTRARRRKGANNENALFVVYNEGNIREVMKHLKKNPYTSLEWAKDSFHNPMCRVKHGVLRAATIVCKRHALRQQLEDSLNANLAKE